MNSKFDDLLSEYCNSNFTPQVRFYHRKNHKKWTLIGECLAVKKYFSPMKSKVALES